MQRCARRTSTRVLRGIAAFLLLVGGAWSKAPAQEPRGRENGEGAPALARPCEAAADLPVDVAERLGLLLCLSSRWQEGERTCSGGCRGYGYEEVKVANEHCGFVTKDRKDKALKAACDLADTNAEALKARAEEAAHEECRRRSGSDECACEGEIRRWEHIYRHILSGKCWAECGWAYDGKCKERGEESGDGEDGG